MKHTGRQILVIRFSSAGDVAMTVPVLHSFKKAFPDARLVILTRPQWLALFGGLDAQFMMPDFPGRHKGLAGLFRLFLDIREQYAIEVVADLHDILRSKVLRLFFQAAGIKTAVIDKGRQEKKQLVRKTDKQVHPLKSGFDRYRDVFIRLGYDFPYDFTSLPLANFPLPPGLPEKKGRWIGVAPFAAFPMKVYPVEQMKKVVEKCILSGDTVMLFGSAAEAGKMDEWTALSDRICNLAGKYRLEEELAVMSRLDIMVAMDSANMHFASLAGTRVVSVWGATHPFSGFYPWQQGYEDAVQIELPCRPCSVFGNKDCYRRDHACMNQLDPGLILNKLAKKT